MRVANLKCKLKLFRIPDGRDPLFAGPCCRKWETTVLLMRGFVRLTRLAACASKPSVSVSLPQLAIKAGAATFSFQRKWYQSGRTSARDQVCSTFPVVVRVQQGGAFLFSGCREFVSRASETEQVPRSSDRVESEFGLRRRRRAGEHRQLQRGGRGRGGHRRFWLEHAASRLLQQYFRVRFFMRLVRI